MKQRPAKSARAVFVLLLTASIATGLSGCADPAHLGGESTPTAKPTRNAISTSTSTPAPSATASSPSASPSTWRISSNGVGPLTLGGDLGRESTELTTYSVSEDGCGFAGITVYDSPSAPTLWVTTASGSSTITAIFLGGGVYSGPQAESPRTDEGVGIGDSSTSAAAAYSVDSESATHWKIDAYSSSTAHVDVQIFDGLVEAVTVSREDEYYTEFCG